MITLFELSVDDLSGEDIGPLLRKTGKAIGGFFKDKAEESGIGLKKIAHASGDYAHKAGKAIVRAAEDAGDATKSAYIKSKRYIGDKYEDKFDKPDGTISSWKRSLGRKYRDTFDDPDNINKARKSIRASEDKEWAKTFKKGTVALDNETNNFKKKIANRIATKDNDYKFMRKALEDKYNPPKVVANQSDDNSFGNKAKKFAGNLFKSNDDNTEKTIKSVKSTTDSDKPSFLDRAKQMMKTKENDSSESFVNKVKKNISNSSQNNTDEVRIKKLKAAIKRQAEDTESTKKNGAAFTGTLGGDSPFRRLFSKDKED